mgnify:CR=1 FL=1
MRLCRAQMMPPCGEDAFFQSNGESPPVVSERVSGTGGTAFIIVCLSGFDASIRNDTCHRCREGDRAKNKAHKSVPCVLYNGRDNTMQWSGLRGSNSLPPPWQGGALPDELNPHPEHVAVNCYYSEPMTYSMVPPIGIEPMTRGFSVPCSTD